jgi:hypothetical protein
MKLQHNYNYNLQLYPTQSNIKLIQIPLQVKANGVDFDVPPGYRYFFDNDAELNNSIITGMSVITRLNTGDNYGVNNYYNITIKGDKDVLLVDNLPLSNLMDKTIGDGNQRTDYRTVKRFNMKPRWDKCYISSNTLVSLGGQQYIYLAVFYKHNGTTHL